MQRLLNKYAPKPTVEWDGQVRGDLIPIPNSNQVPVDQVDSTMTGYIDRKVCVVNESYCNFLKKGARVDIRKDIVGYAQKEVETYKSRFVERFNKKADSAREQINNNIDSINRNISQDAEEYTRNLQAKNGEFDDLAEESDSESEKDYEKVFKEWEDESSSALSNLDLPGDVAESIEGWNYQTPLASPQGQEIQRTKNYVDFARDQIQVGSPYAQQRYRLVDHAEKSMLSADEFFVEGDQEAGNLALGVAKELASLGIAFVPQLWAANWCKSLVETVSGYDLIRQEELSTFDRMLSAVDVLTLGVSSKGLKIFTTMRRIGSKVHGANILKTEKFLECMNKAEKAADSAKRFELPSNKLGEYMGRLRNAGKTKGNFDMPKGTRNEAKFLGESWVGPEAIKTPYRNQPGKFVYTSKDGTKQFREAVTKRDGRTLTNFQWKDPVTRKWVGNGHMTITD